MDHVMMLVYSESSLLQKLSMTDKQSKYRESTAR